MDTKFTKGPWSSERTGQGWGVVARKPMRGRIDSQITGMTEADAHLCAAAPDMFEALEAWLEPRTGGAENHQKQRARARQLGRAALAKARGQ